MACIPNNERKICDAVAAALEKIIGASRQDAYSPEDGGGDGQVEYVFTISGVRYAAEHTLVEAFDGQRQADLYFDDFIKPISAALDGKMPVPGVYSLYFSISPTKGIRKAEIPTARDAVIEWTQKTASSLHQQCPRKPSKDEMPFGHRSSEKTTVHGIDVLLSRETSWSISSRHDGKLLPGRFAPADHEVAREVRIDRAINKKLSKLAACSAEGARTLLILENQDIALSNHFNIASAVEKALHDREFVPDEVWLVDTTIGTEWTAWCLLRESVVFPFGDGAHKFFDFDPAKLKDV